MSERENTQTETEQSKSTPTRKTELNISAEMLNIKVGEVQTIGIETNATSFTMESNNSQVVQVNRITKQIKGVGKGDAIVAITAQVTDGDLVEKTIEVNVNQNLTTTFGDANEVLENVYPYDETLPLSVNGTIAYKRGDSDNDPLIKLVFDGRLQRWQVVGIKITKWNKNNDPYQLYFMASEGAVNEALTNMSLEIVIVDMIDTLFQSEVPNMKRTIQDVFDTVIDPLIESQMTNIPLLVKNAITEELQKIIEEAIAVKLDDKFGEIIENKIDDKIANEYEFGQYTPHKKNDTPKWAGIIYFYSETLFPPSNGTSIYTTYNSNNKLKIYRRLNTNGIEESWCSAENPSINDISSGYDNLTLLFNQIEPFKSVDRYEFMWDDLCKISGDSIYSKEIFERLASQSNDKHYKDFNGLGSATLPTNRDSHWMLAYKKCHFINLNFKINDNPTIYTLHAMGENEFTIDLKDYFPNLTKVDLDYINEPKIGFYPYYVEGSKIRSQVFPAFYNFYDLQGNILASPMELDYVYLSAFNASLHNATGNPTYKGKATTNNVLCSQPTLANSIVNNTCATAESYFYFNTFGHNPAIGTNFRNVDFYRMYLLVLMKNIEHPTTGFNNDTKTISNGNYISQGSQYSQKIGWSFPYGNKTVKMKKTYANHLSYRGYENNDWLLFLKGYFNVSNTIMGMYRPHSHRIVLPAHPSNVTESNDIIHVPRLQALIGLNDLRNYSYLIRSNWISDLFNIHNKSSTNNISDWDDTHWVFSLLGCI